MKALLDTNVILDVLLKRAPHFSESAAVWAAIEEGRAEGCTPARAITTIHYIARKVSTAQAATETVRLILEVLEVAGVSGDVIHEAIQLDWPDFEDAVTASAALEAGCDLIVTRDTAGFAGSKVKAMTPRAALTFIMRSASGQRRR